MHRQMQPSCGQEPNRPVTGECAGLFNAKELAEADNLLAAICEENREQLIDIFLQENVLSKEALAEKTGLQDCLLTRHLNALRNAGLLSRYYQKGVMVYELDKGKLHKTSNLTSDFLSTCKANGDE